MGTVEAAMAKALGWVKVAEAMLRGRAAAARVAVSLVVVAGAEVATVIVLQEEAQRAAAARATEARKVMETGDSAVAGKGAECWARVVRVTAAMRVTACPALVGTGM
eukprot:scaffold166005_cov32-Tisochrysis_lutea.AAC.1